MSQAWTHGAHSILFLLSFLCLFYGPWFVVVLCLLASFVLCLCSNGRPRPRFRPKNIFLLAAATLLLAAALLFH